MDLSTEKCDGNLVTFIQGELDFGHTHKNTIYFDDKYPHGIKSDFYTRYLSYAGYLLSCEKCNAVEVLKKDIQRSIKKCLASAYKDLPAEVVETIIDGKLRISLLINSPGGKEISAMDNIKEIVEEKEFFIDAYITEKAYSAAAIVSEKASFRAAMENSKFLWYQGSIHPDKLEEMNEEAFEYSGIEIDHDLEEKMNKERLEESLNFLKKSCPLSRLSKLNRKINQAKKNIPDQEILFDAAELHYFGYIDIIAKTRAELCKIFINRTGIVFNKDFKTLIENQNLLEIAKFFLF